MAVRLHTVPRTLTESIDATRVVYRQLGRSGLRISNPILGTMGFGHPNWLNWVLGEEQALPLLKAAYDKGINTWDTANVYSNGESERIIGKALRKYNIPRQKVTIMTKCYRPMADDDDAGSIVALLCKTVDASKDYVNQHGLSRSAILTAVEASLERLQTTYIDVLQIHRFDDSIPPEETMGTLHELVKNGKVRYIGASSMWAHQLATLQFTAERYGWTKFISMQNHYNLLYREEEREMNRFCHSNGIGLIPWSPLAGGLLARPLDVFGHTPRSASDSKDPRFPIGQSNADREIIRRVHEVAARRNWPMSNVALAWINRRVTAPVIGLSSVGRMDEALAARDRELTPEEERYLEAPYQPKAVLGHS